jgi:hypothetical protein
MGIALGEPRRQEAEAVYDVLFLDRTHGEKVLAQGLGRDDACAFARSESERRGIGRMFLAGSEIQATGEVIVIVESAKNPA